MNIRIGIIGTGNIIKKHVEAINQIKGIEISCVCDKDPEKLKIAEDRLECRGYNNYIDMLKEELDVVLVSLPHGLHCKATIDGLNAGCHVMVEKPMAVSVEECNKMLTTAKALNKHIIVTELASFQPGVLKTGEKFKKGILGRFFTGSIINIRNYFHDERPAWFLDPEMSGGGMFSNVGLHRLAVARGCLPGLAPQSVTASVCYIPKYRIEACTSAIVKYKDEGSMLYEEVGYYPKPEWLNTGTHFIFEEGIVMWDSRYWRMIDKHGEEWKEELQYVENSYIDIYYNMLKALKGEEYHSTAYEYAQDVAIAQAAYASESQGKEICLNEQEWTIKE